MRGLQVESAYGSHYGSVLTDLFQTDVGYTMADPKAVGGSKPIFKRVLKKAFFEKVLKRAFFEKVLKRAFRTAGQSRSIKPFLKFEPSLENSESTPKRIC